MLVENGDVFVIRTIIHGDELTMPMTILLNSLETSVRLLSAFKDDQPTGSDPHLVADDAVEAIYAAMDVVALRMPPMNPAPDLSAG